MELTLAFGLVNWYAVLIATVVVFIIGGVWYSPHLFGKPGVISESAEMFGGPARRLYIMSITR